MIPWSTSQELTRAINALIHDANFMVRDILKRQLAACVVFSLFSMLNMTDREDNRLSYFQFAINNNFYMHDMELIPGD